MNSAGGDPPSTMDIAYAAARADPTLSSSLRTSESRPKRMHPPAPAALVEGRTLTALISASGLRARHAPRPPQPSPREGGRHRRQHPRGAPGSGSHQLDAAALLQEQET